MFKIKSKSKSTFTKFIFMPAVVLLFGLCTIAMASLNSCGCYSTNIEDNFFTNDVFVTNVTTNELGVSTNIIEVVVTDMTTNEIHTISRIISSNLITNYYVDSDFAGFTRINGSSDLISNIDAVLTSAQFRLVYDENGVLLMSNYLGARTNISLFHLNRISQKTYMRSVNSSNDHVKFHGDFDGWQRLQNTADYRYYALGGPNHSLIESADGTPYYSNDHGNSYAAFYYYTNVLQTNESESFGGSNNYEEVFYSNSDFPEYTNLNPLLRFYRYSLATNRYETISGDEGIVYSNHISTTENTMQIANETMTNLFVTTFNASNTVAANGSYRYYFTSNAYSLVSDDDGVGYSNNQLVNSGNYNFTVPYDDDADGFIDIDNLDQLHSIRYDLNAYGVVTNDLYLSAFSGFVNGSYRGYELKRDLNFNSNDSYAAGSTNMTTWRSNDTSSEGWLPIGDSSNPFLTTFEGNNFSILNLYINQISNNHFDGYGLFGTVGEHNLQNVGLEDVQVRGRTLTGALVGVTGGNVRNCFSTGSVEGENSTGGLVGEFRGQGQRDSLIDCYSTASVKGLDLIGGLAGQASRMTIRDCYATGSVEGWSQVGGLIGWAHGSTVSRCYATGSVLGMVSSDNPFAYGGLIGIAGEASIDHCYATGNVNAVHAEGVGGLIGSQWSGHFNINNGYRDDADIANCYATGNVTGNRYVGSFAGRSEDVGSTGTTLTYDNCYAIGNVTGNTTNSNDVGRFIGEENNTINDITSCYYNSNATVVNNSTGGINFSAVGQSPSALQMPTDASGIYAAWPASSWDFGSSTQYPELKVDFDGDGTATSGEFGPQHGN